MNEVVHACFRLAVPRTGSARWREGGEPPASLALPPRARSKEQQHQQQQPLTQYSQLPPYLCMKILSEGIGGKGCAQAAGTDGLQRGQRGAIPREGRTRTTQRCRRRLECDGFYPPVRLLAPAHMYDEPVHGMAGTGGERKVTGRRNGPATVRHEP